MGEVYKARDIRLDRTVAIKVLPEHVASDPDLQQRFEREAKTISSLNHPHICTLHDIGNQDGIDFLVMEYLEGDTLAQRLTKGPLPTAQVLRYAAEIADALDKAHGQGITHRDLKPGNIMLTKAGAKLLDFGLAKLRPPGTVGTDGFSAAVTASEPLTGRGTILSTLQYMAPEQLGGKDADHRTDIFAFGAVVYEMATGQRAFSGESQASLIGAILKDEPSPMSTLQTMTPAALDYIVKTCLAKDPDDRWQSAGDVGRQVQGIVEGGSQPGMAALIPAESGRRGWHRAVPWLYGLVVGALAAWVFISLIPSSPVSVTRTTIRLAAGHQLDLGRGFRDVAISPDGTRVVYAAQSDAANLIFVRRLDQSDVVPLTRSESRNPFISPDGTTVGYFTGAFPSLLRRVSIQGGGPSTTICEVSGFGRGASWGPDGTIIFATAPETAGSQRSSGSGGLWRVHAEGGDAEQLTSPVAAAGELDHRWPEILPGGRDVLFTITGSTSQESKIALLALDTLDYTVLIRGGTYARYSPTGHLALRGRGDAAGCAFRPQQPADDRGADSRPARSRFRTGEGSGPSQRQEASNPSGHEMGPSSIIDADARCSPSKSKPILSSELRRQRCYSTMSSNAVCSRRRFPTTMSRQKVDS